MTFAWDDAMGHSGQSSFNPKSALAYMSEVKYECPLIGAMAG